MTLYYYNENGEFIDGPNPRMRGDYSELRGNCSGLELDLNTITDRMRASELSIAEIAKLLTEKSL